MHNGGCYVLVHIQAELYEKLLQHAKSALPNEACGIIIGNSDTERVTAETFVPLRNHSSDPQRHFEISPLEMITHLANDHHQIVGLFHSHPTAPPIPSKEDSETLWHTIPTHWIVSLQSPSRPELQIYEIKKTTTTALYKLSFVIGQ
jgi:[CysO sulfur-carrier protein]-S-L-cysteine hydrolase